MPKTHIIEALLEEKPDLKALCISETWLNSEKLQYLHINGFFIATSTCRENREGGGVCILLRNFIEYKERIDIKKMSVESIFEICGIELCNTNVVLIVVSSYIGRIVVKEETFFTNS